MPREKQYAAARCEMGDDICMYGRSASSGVESMNRANKLVRLKTSVDMLNAAVLLLQLEGKRFHKWKANAWACDTPFTPRGMQIMKDVFENVTVTDYRLRVIPNETMYSASVSKNTTGARVYHVNLPRNAYNGSHFGKCTCGVPAKDGIPCVHMAVLVRSSEIPILTRSNIMPYFWSTQHWQTQFSLEEQCITDISISSVKRTTLYPMENIRYCPDWSASEKPGRRKNTDKVDTLTDKMKLASTGKKRKRSVKLYCDICQKFNHTTLNCYKNPRHTGGVSRNLESTLELTLPRGDRRDKDGDQGSA
jgi:hypothetical protein